LHTLLSRFDGFARLLLGPSSRDKNRIKMFGSKGFENEVRRDPLGVSMGVEFPGGFTLVTPGSGMFDIVIKSIRTFMSGEAEDALAAVWHMTRNRLASTFEFKTSHPWLESFFSLLSYVAGWVMWAAGSEWWKAVWTRLSLGLSLIGSMSFITLLIGSSLMGPVQLANNLRFGRGYV
jgi:hypothetical protein